MNEIKTVIDMRSTPSLNQTSRGKTNDDYYITCQLVLTI